MTFLKLALLAAPLFAGREYLASECRAFRRFIVERRRGVDARAVVYTVLYLSSGLSPLSWPFLASSAARTLLSVYFVFSWVVIALHRRIAGSDALDRAYFDDDVLELLWRERRSIVDAWRTYMRVAAPILAIASLGFIVFVLPSAPLPVSDSWPLTLTAVSFGGVLLVYVSGWTAPFPLICAIPIQLLLHMWRWDLVPQKEPTAVRLHARGASLKKVIFVMDESVRGDYLTLGDATLSTTPYLSGIAGALINFGIATSSHNCSSYSRYMLRYGARAEDLRYRLRDGLNFEGPSIWQYARAAGFKTVYIDGFSSSRRLHSGMTTSELRFVDDYLTIPDAPPHQRDLLVAGRLLEALKDPAPAFIYVDKHGLHAPYDDKFPSDHKAYEPEGNSPRATLLASYKNAVRWNVDGFFRKALPHIDFADAALFYTSDHGQSLMDNGYALSHCSTGSNIADGEALVPLFAIVESDPLRSMLAASAARFFNKASHFDLFPALLVALGYEAGDVRRAYGDGLLGEPQPQRKFLVGFKRHVRWVTVHSEALTDARRVRGLGVSPPAPAFELTVISRERDVARRAHMAKMLQALDLPFSFFPAVDAELGEHAGLSRHDARVARWSGGWVLAPCEIGCFASHYLVWQRCLAADRPFIVFEDDVAIHAGFPLHLDMASRLLDQGLVRLGFNASGRRPLAPTTLIMGGQRVFLCPPGSTSGSFCYAISPRHAGMLIANAERWTEPIDHYLETTYQHGVKNFSFEVVSVTHPVWNAPPSTMTARRHRHWRPRLRAFAAVRGAQRAFTGRNGELFGKLRRQ